MQGDAGEIADDLRGVNEETAGTLLDGRVSYLQKREGYRTGLEPVLLAASIPARSGQAVVEAGTGAGAGILTLASRVAGLTCLGIEADPSQAALARRNLDRNGLASCRIEVRDVALWRPVGLFDHAFANPPWHSERSTGSPVSSRRAAKCAAPGLLDIWTAALATCLRRRRTLSLILPAASLAAGVSALAGAHCAEITLIPFWRHHGEAARLIILRGVAGGKGACTVHPGLVLHRPDGALTDRAEAILRKGEALT